MNNEFSLRDQRRAAAKAHRRELMNARGEVDCAECGAEVDEARGNRNAQELEREGVRKNKGPICNACQASWRYSHHQDSEMEMANADLPAYCSTCGVSLSFKESHKHREQGHDVGPAPKSRDNSEIECPKCSSRDLKVNAESFGPTHYKCKECGHQFTIERKNAAGKCSRCGAGIGKDGSLGVEHGNDIYCVDCAVEKGYIDKEDVA